MPWIIAILVFLLITQIGLVIFSWRNAALSIHPRLIQKDYEIEWNRKKGLWRDFDSYTTKDYEIKGKDGYILHATFVDNEEVRGSGKYVIILHGHTSSRYGAVKYLNSYIKLGFSCVIYDARTHGDNAPDKCTLGNVEAEDLLKVIEDTRNRFSDIKVLGLQGESMGSATSLTVTRYYPRIDFIVADCPFTGAHDVITDCYKKVYLHFLVPCIRLAGMILYKVDLNNTSALKDLDNKNIPILFIHGAGDTFISPEHSKRLYEKASKSGAYTELILVEGAGHARCRYVAGFEKYTEYIENFLKKSGVI
ncbi:MAG: alpha/beta fold hydrolase [Ruminococcus sp.]|nr:alpha/beta fold hydrolase [Ruminococcus sp.]